MVGAVESHVFLVLVPVELLPPRPRPLTFVLPLELLHPSRSEHFII